MKYEIGQEFYGVVPTTQQMTTGRIVDIKYQIEGVKGPLKYMNEEQFANFLEERNFVLNKSDFKTLKIKQLEKELGIKLQEIE